MRARLVAYSKATPEFEAEGLTDLQELIAFCAKVSNPSAQINTATSERLIKYLIKHQHWSPNKCPREIVFDFFLSKRISKRQIKHNKSY